MTVTSVEVAEGALREVGAFASYDVEPDPSEMAVTLQYLKDILAEKVGTEQLWFFVPKDITIPLVTGVGLFDLNKLTLAASDVKLQFIMQAKIVDTTTGRQHDVELVRRERWEDLQGDTSLKNPGRPRYLYVERNDDPQAECLPVPLNNNFQLRIWGQIYPQDILRQGPGAIPLGFPDAWKLALEIELTATIGRGPVVSLPPQQLQYFEGLAKSKWEKLMVRNNKENVKRPRITRPRKF